MTQRYYYAEGRSWKPDHNRSRFWSGQQSNNSPLALLELFTYNLLTNLFTDERQKLGEIFFFLIQITFGSVNILQCFEKYKMYLGCLTTR